MKLRELKVRNFRCLVDVVVPIDDTTILVGENNSGKTALLNALRIALTRAMGGRVGQFDEYDYYMEKAGDSPETSGGIVVELWFREDATDVTSVVTVLSKGQIRKANSVVCPVGYTWRNSSLLTA